MNKKILKNISLVLVFIMLSTTLVYGDSNKVVTLAKDIDESQRKEILDIFGVKEDEVVIIEVNNQEERKYLEGIVSEAQIGTRTISSAYLELLGKDSGIQVETHNISWVSKDMFASALITAGVKDARIIAAAPFPVSGTGALTGILKSFEQATGVKIDEEKKKVATQEIVETGELGEIFGQDKAAELIRSIKEAIIEEGVKSPEDIERVISQAASKLDIKLSQNQIDSINNLMDKISKLDINVDDFKEQMKDLGKKIEDTLKNNKEVRSWIKRFFDALLSFFRVLFKK